MHTVELGQTDKQTDRHTDGRTDCSIAYCPSTYTARRDIIKVQVVIAVVYGVISDKT